MKFCYLALLLISVATISTLECGEVPVGAIGATNEEFFPRAMPDRPINCLLNFQQTHKSPAPSFTETVSQQAAVYATSQVTATVAITIVMHFVKKFLGDGENAAAEVNSFVLEREKENVQILKEFKKLEAEYLIFQRKIAKGEGDKESCRELEDKFIRAGGREAMKIILEYQN